MSVLTFSLLVANRRVLKIETVGDCYVAASGLPEADPNHAVQLARFARDIMLIFGRLTRELEVTLGPDTGDLLLRIGINSGPVVSVDKDVYSLGSQWHSVNTL